MTQKKKAAVVVDSLKAPVYYSNWDSYEDMKSSWAGWDWHGNKASDMANFPEPHQIIFASYGQESYEGDALVIFETEEGLFENVGGHCSCNGLEGQWDPEKTTWAAIAMRRSSLYSGHSDEARMRLSVLLAENNR